MRKKYYLALPFVNALVINKNDEVLLGLHPKSPHKPYPLTWDMPGGKIKKNETFEEAMEREFIEETGLNILDMKLYGTFHHSEKEIRPDAKTKCLPGVCVCYKVEAKGNLVNTEFVELRWVPKEEITSLKLTPWCEFFLKQVKHL